MKRFYTDVTVHSARSPENSADAPHTAGPYEVYLDDRPVRTPKKHPLIIGSKPLAEAVAQEWADQPEQRVDVHAMPITRHVCTAIDRISQMREMTVAEIANYARSDVLCYRAENPENLVQRQTDAWQPVLDWMAQNLDAPLLTATGIQHVEQPVTSIDNIKADLVRRNDVELAALHTLSAGMKSVGLALAVAYGFVSATEAYEKSILDEMFQTEHWGDDQEWKDRREALKDVILSAERVLQLNSASV